MKDMEVGAYFAERQFQNAEKAPDKLNSDAEVVDFVSKEVGGIGFVSAGAVSGNVKVVLEF
jgi:hypothetical protein